MRTRTMTSIEADIAKVQAALIKTQKKYDSLAEDLKALVQEKDDMMARSLMDSFKKSGKSYEELMKFLTPNG